MTDALKLYSEDMQNSSLKIGIILTEKDHQTLRFAYKNVPQLLKQQYRELMIGFGVFKNNFIYNLFEKTMIPLVESGIPQHFLNRIMKFHLKPPDEEPETPKVFTLNDLQFGFIIWIITCLIAISAFFLEILWFYARILITNLIRLHLFIIFFNRTIFN